MLLQALGTVTHNTPAARCHTDIAEHADKVLLLTQLA